MTIISSTHIYFTNEDQLFSTYLSCVFTHHDNEWDNVHAAFIYSKARFFKDYKSASKVRTCTSPKTCTSIGRKIKPFSEKIWHMYREACMCEILLSKYSQNPYYAIELMATENKILVFVSSSLDDEWGIGMTVENALAQNKKIFVGNNLLGKCLMNVRDALRRKSLVISSLKQ